MSFTGFRPVGGLTACATALAFWPVAASADVTPAELWESWQAYGAASGQTLSASGQSQADGRLVLRDVTADMAHQGGRMHSEIAEIVMTDRGDGTVAITVSPDYEITVTGTDRDGAAFELKLDAQLEGMSMIASGDPDSTTYALSADAFSITTASATRAGQAAQFDLAATVTGIAGTYAMDSAEGGLFRSDLAAAGMTFDLDTTEPGQGGTTAIAAEYDDISIAAAGSAAALAGGVDPAALLGGRLELGGNFTQGGGSFSVDMRAGADRLGMTVHSAGGSSSSALAGAELTQTGRGEGLDVVVTDTRLRQSELRFGIDRLSYDLALPVAPTDAPGPFSAQLELDGVKLSEATWAMVDPQSALPHDPAALRIDLGGMARVTEDLSDPAAYAGPVAPFEPVSIDLRELRLELAGTTLTGEGAVSFDATDLRSYAGMPAPLGAVDLRLDGSTMLTENLVTLGILPRDQLVFAQIILGMFAKPVEGQDALKSRIEDRKSVV